MPFIHLPLKAGQGRDLREVLTEDSKSSEVMENVLSQVSNPEVIGHDLVFQFLLWGRKQSLLYSISTPRVPEGGRGEN